MVFSFFKKPPEKMVARPAAAPVRAKPEPSPAAGPAGMPGSAEEKDAPRELAPLDFTTSNIQSPAAAAPAMVSPSDFSDLSESPEGFHVEMDVDPVEADVEQAAVLYANGQDAATGAVAVPNGTIGSRWDKSGKWNLEAKNLADGSGLRPQMTFIEDAHMQSVILY